MESQIIDWLNGYNIRVGTLVLIFTGIVFCIIFVYRGRKKYDKFLKELVQDRVDKIKESEEKNKEILQDRKNMEDVKITLDLMSKNISKLNERVDEFHTKISNSEKFQKDMKSDIASIQEEIKKNTENIDILLDSDRENIRSEILRNYYICLKEQKIDLYTLNVLEAKFKKYVVIEHGNTFVKRLMEELRGLPKVINYSHINETDPIGYFNDHPEILEEMGINKDEVIQ